MSSGGCPSARPRDAAADADAGGNPTSPRSYGFGAASIPRSEAAVSQADGAA
jgi:hypothetical protein